MNDTDQVSLFDAEPVYITVTELSDYIKGLVERDATLRDVRIKGEISNFTNHKSGHFYFTVKDENSVVRAIMFGGKSRLKFLPENGMKVLIRGRVSIYQRDGQYQIYCDEMEPDGIGGLYLAYEQLKNKLEAEGLFDKSRKKPLPKTPLTVGVITSPTGAAVRDMVNVLTRRFPLAKVVIFPALVQGDGAPAQLISGVNFFNTRSRADVIIIGRGGGSIEDLSAFNDEKLARTIAASVVPVISAVGHETDFTICDFAADLRAPTPSAAAELAVPETGELKAQFANVLRKLEILIQSGIRNRRERTANFSSRRVLVKPDAFIDDRRMNLLNIEKHLTAAQKIGETARKARFDNLAAKLSALSPLASLGRGYAVAVDSSASVIRSVASVKQGDEMRVLVTDGEIFGTVTGVKQTQSD